MTQIIEVFGLSGTGKSTLCESINKNSKITMSAMTALILGLQQHRLNSKHLSKPKIQRVIEHLAYNVLMKISPLRKFGIKLLLSSPYFIGSATISLAVQTPRLCKYLHKHYSENKSEDFKSAYSGFLNSIIMIEVLRKADIKVPIILDEGPTKYLQSLLQCEQDLTQRHLIISEVLQHFSCLVGGIFVYSEDFDILYHRLLNRKSGPPMNLRTKSKDELFSYFKEEQSILRQINHCFHQRELHQLVLQSDLEIDEKLTTSFKFIRDLKGR